ncbi:MAG: hypothetical protein U5R06_20135 [candidate division KSB1 bacterium]|nr:hypothetical protein [candidate division KSB1 bacterium]
MISMVIRLTMLPEFPFQGELTALVNSDSDSLLANNTVEQMFFVLQRPGPLLNTDITVNQIVHLDSSAVSADIPTFYYEPEQQVRFDVNVINKEQVPAENVTLVNVIPEHFVFVSADPEPDQVSLDSLFWMFSEVLTQESIELILKAPEAHEPEPLMGMNKGRVSASNEDSASLDDNVTSVKLIQIIREIEPFTPEIQVTPRIADVSDSLVVQVRFPVEISTWDLWIYLPDGEIVTDFADWYIETQSILPDQWYTVDEVYRHSELHNKSQDELVFKLTATSVTGAQGTAGDQVLVRSGDKLSIDRNVYQPDLEEPIIIRFKIKLSGRVRLDLWDISGDHVTRVLDQILSAGWHDLSWNGTTETGKRIGSGVYLLTIRTAGENNYKKLIIVR